MTTLLRFRLMALPLLAAVLWIGAGPARAACVIPESPCYPWHIREGEDDTVLLEIIPTNVATGAIYRICVCPPAPDISIVFDFQEGSRTLGTLASRPSAPVCRDYRFQTARTSSLKLRRASAGTAPVEGCYFTY